jgi:hypothetical protein
MSQWDMFLSLVSAHGGRPYPGRTALSGDVPPPRPDCPLFGQPYLDRGGAEGDLMELNGWSSPQMLQRYGGSARGARARRHYNLIMRD